MERLVQITKVLLIAVLMVPAACEADLRGDRTGIDESGIRDDSDLRADTHSRMDSSDRPIGRVEPGDRAALTDDAESAERAASADDAEPDHRAAPAGRAATDAPGLPTAADTSEFREERYEMVRSHIASRGIDDPLVLDALRAVPRHRFVPRDFEQQAYADRPLPIGHGQTISQPYIVAYMTELVEPDASDRVLEIGTGSGYQAAVLAQIVDSVYTMEIVPELARTARDRLQMLGYGNVRVRQADGYFGWEEHAPFDAIVVTAAAEHIPPPLVAQLKDGGRMIIPVGSPFRTQTLMLVDKQGDELSTRSVAPVRFVPFTRDN